MRASALSLFACALAGSAAAQETDSWSYAAALGAVSDYRWRGVTQTDGGPALQAEVTAQGPGGVYVTAWASNVTDWREADGLGPQPGASARLGGPGAPAHNRALELSASLGRAFELREFRFDLALSRFGYPGGPAGYFEIPVSVSRSFGPATLTAGASWAPPQPGTGGVSDRYVYLAVAWADPRWPVQPRAALGKEQGAFGPSKIDWSAGLTARYRTLEFSLDMVGANEGAGSTLVAGLQRRF